MNTQDQSNFKVFLLTYLGHSVLDRVLKTTKDLLPKDAKDLISLRVNYELTPDTTGNISIKKSSYIFHPNTIPDSFHQPIIPD